MTYPIATHSRGVVVAALAALLFMASRVGISEEPATSDAAEKPESPRVSVEVARDRAVLMHEVSLATLEVMHDRYFHREKSVVPARAMQDVFDHMRQQSHIDAKWIAVNSPAMSVDHEPETDFEKFAAKELAAGKPMVERVEKGFYQRAATVPLTSDCIGCHDGFFKSRSTVPKFAGLIIRVPVREAAMTPVE
jgi:hypothetical protein